MNEISAVLCTLVALCATDGYAEETNFSVNGKTVFYDTETGNDRSISPDDIDHLRTLLKDNPMIDTLVLNSEGGTLWVGEELARVTLDYELNTVVDGECSSSCVNIFLAGASRRMTRGSQLGFHLSSWSPSSIESYYDSWAEEYGWDTPFEQGSWIYTDTQAEVYDSLIYMTSRGVDPMFAINSKTPRKETWFPVRQELLDAGVLTE